MFDELKIATSTLSKALEKLEETSGKKENEDYLSFDYVIVRTYNFGVFAGYLDKEKSTDTVKVLRRCRRLWHWEGAFSLSTLATDGTALPHDCRFPAEVDEVTLSSPTYGFEICKCTKKARESIQNVPVFVPSNLK